MPSTPRDQLPYDDSDVATAERRLRALVADLPEVTEPRVGDVAHVTLVRRLDATRGAAGAEGG